MAGMGGLFQLAEMLLTAAAILAIWLIVAYLVSRLFQTAKTRKRIMWGAVSVYLIAFVGYFGFIAFILSGNLN
jgi:hypothetical protein